MKVLHVITGLSIGGAEMMLLKLLRSVNRTRFEHQVISMTDFGAIADEIAAIGISVTALGMSRRCPNPLRLISLMRYIRRVSPDIIHNWMYHANLFGGVAGRIAGHRRIIWDIRHANLDVSLNKWSTVQIAKLGRYTSGMLVDRIVFNSEAARYSHSELGYSSDRIILISNGFDTDLFRPDPALRESVRKELGIDENAVIVGIVGRCNPQKDYGSFFAASERVAAHSRDVVFVMCGKGVSWDNPAFAALAGGVDRSRYHPLGLRTDIPRIMASFDIAVSSSVGEGFSNAVGEAMSCGVPCAVTDVGDSARIVGDTGITVSPGDPSALADSIRHLVALGDQGRRSMGTNARERICSHYSLQKAVGQYEQLYDGLLESRH